MTVTNIAATPNNGIPQGTVTFSSDGAGTFIDSSEVLSGGLCSATYSPSSAAGSPHTITATYVPDSDKWAASNQEKPVTVTWCVEVNVMGSATPLVVNEWTWVTATVAESTGMGPTPTGTVDFSLVNGNDDGEFFAGNTQSLDFAGQCQVKYRPLSTDTGAVHEIEAAYSGSHSDNSGTYEQAIEKREADVVMTVSPSSAYILEAVNVTVCVKDDSTAGDPPVLTGMKVTLTTTASSGGRFNDTHSSPYEVTLDATGCWTGTYTPGAYETGSPVPALMSVTTLTATFAAASSDESSVYGESSTAELLTVNLRPVKTKVEGSMAPLLVLQEYEFKCTVLDDGPADSLVQPVGTVTYSASSLIDQQLDPASDSVSGGNHVHFDYICIGLPWDGGSDLVQAHYVASDGIHADSSAAFEWSMGGFSQGLMRRPTVTTLSGGVSSPTGVDGITATVTEDPSNAPDDYNSTCTPIGGKIAMLPVTIPPAPPVTAWSDLCTWTTACEPVGCDFDVDVPAALLGSPTASVTVRYFPNDNVHLSSTASETFDRSDQIPEVPDPDPGNDGSDCHDGCGDGGTDIENAIYALNSTEVALSAVKMALDVVALILDIGPDPIAGAGCIVITGFTVPTSDIASAIISGAAIAIDIAITAMDTDLDDDGIPDTIEETITHTDPFKVDSDGDGMGDLDEIDEASGYYGGTRRPSPNDSDSDDDGISDGDEANITHTDFCVADTDCDTLTDGQEYATWRVTTAIRDQADPLMMDTDGDGLGDAVEIGAGCPYVNDDDSDDDGLQDGYEDTTGLGIYDPATIGDTGTAGSGDTNLCDPDTDGDGLLDGEEEGLFGRGSVDITSQDGLLSTEPALDKDSDDDGLSDGEEVNVTHTDPLDWDTDNDGLSDLNELLATGGSWPQRTFSQVSDPLDPDTDDDEILDNFEYNGTGASRTDHFAVPSGTDDLVCPIVNDDDSDDDGLQDGIEDANRNGVWDSLIAGNSTTQKLAGETNICDPDTDHDGLTDGEEVSLFGGLPVLGTFPYYLQAVPTTAGNTIPALDDDSDNDGLSDYEEVNITGTDPLDGDTDGDTISDADELIAVSGLFGHRTFIQVSDPLDPDTDDDGLTDEVEWTVGHTYHGTGLGDPSSTYFRKTGGNPDTICPIVNDDDSDDDGLQDGYEDKNQNGIWDNYSLGTSSSAGSGETCACHQDSDRDGLSDGEEEGLLGRTATPQGASVAFGVDGVPDSPTVPALDDDSDDDGLSDYEEANVTHTNPLDYDTDDDTLSDANELIATGWLVLNPGYSLTFVPREFQQESDPLDPDTDDDDLYDYIEYPGTQLGSTYLRILGGVRDIICPYVNDDDSDDDGLQDGTEDSNHDGTWGVNGSGITCGNWASQSGKTVDYWETDLCNPDTDGDGLLDGEEVQLLGGGPILGRPRPLAGFYTVTPEAASSFLPVGSTTVPAGYAHPSPIPGTKDDLIAPYAFVPAAGDPLANTIPALDSDSDNDGLSDYEEVNVTSTDPLDQDSDNDTLKDADELIATGGAWPSRAFDQESDPLDINTDDDHLFDPQEYAGSGLSTAAGAAPAGSRDTACPLVNDDDSDNDGNQDGAVVTITPKGVITFGGAQYSYTHYEDFIDLDVADEEHPGVVRIVAISGYGEQQDDGDWDVCDSDSDGDGLNDGEEVAIGTNPNDWDTDDDGRNDWHEVTGGGPIPTDPFDPDTDDDGLLDSAEVLGSNNTNPANADTDGDGLCDGGAGTPWMYSNDARIVVNPICKSCSTPKLVDCGTSSTRTGSPDGIGDHPNRFGFGEDQNGNGAWDRGERETDPNQYDTDGDAIADGIERLSFSTSRDYMIPPKDLLGREILVTYPEANNLKNPCECLDPLNADSDRDGLSDGYEDANHDGNFDFLPSDFDIFESSVETSLPDPEETNPCAADSDVDGLTDWEERYQRQPLLAAPPLPFNDDWLTGDTLVDEDPIDGIDNDLDGLIDEDPAEGPIALTFNPTNPLDWDTDNDWLSDGQEVHWPCFATEYTQLDNDTDGYINEDWVDGLDNDGDGLFDEDPVDFWVRFVPMLDPTNRDSDSDGFIDGLDEDPCNSEMIPLVEPAVLEPVDSDGDGFSDDDEIAAGTHPNDPEDHPTAYGTVDVDFDECIDDRIWLEPGACCGEAGWVVVDLDNNVLIDLRIAITSKSVKHGDFDKDGYEDDVRYTVEYVLSDYRAVQLRGIATIDDYNSDLVIDRVVVERK